MLWAHRAGAICGRRGTLWIEGTKALREKCPSDEGPQMPLWSSKEQWHSDSNVQGRASCTPSRQPWEKKEPWGQDRLTSTQTKGMLLQEQNTWKTLS